MQLNHVLGDLPLAELSTGCLNCIAEWPTG